MKVAYEGQFGVKSRPDFAFRPMNTTELFQAQKDYGIVGGSGRQLIRQCNTSIPVGIIPQTIQDMLALTPAQKADADRILDSIVQR